ncbi:ArsR/SmtB family transcription factor [Saccharopolyspora rosea]|uniref:ArsR/SmtB family transcription factor n=1 Tax=Saccharopolyspora rosea TaxID=524884 RepID=A0ABW3FUG6_9PSEU|nr:metalloregulator ArsR/SmtB family transcription factor [Saccharopolyspora rosea]
MPAVSPDSAAEPARSTASAGRLHQHDEHVPSPERDSRPAPLRDQRTLVEAGELLRALAAPVRIAIVLQLRVSERCVHELVDALGVAQPLISQHLRVLKSAGVVHGERHGREVVYRLVDEHLAHIVVDAAAHAEETAGRSRPAADSAPIAPHSSRQETETA